MLNSDPEAFFDGFMSENGTQSLDLRYVADLARLDLTDEELVTFEPQLQKILSYMERLDEVDVSGIEPMAYANPVLNVMRPDQARPSLSPEDALRNGPKTTSDQFVVPKVID